MASPTLENTANQFAAFGNFDFRDTMAIISPHPR
jgi:hypothetical protein